MLQGSCWDDVTARARTLGRWGDGAAEPYKWVLRSRPDVVWWAPLPSIGVWATDAIYLRARRVGMMRGVEDEMLSWWKYMQPQWGVCDLGCAWRDTRSAVSFHLGCIPLG